jgi:hypothetical protein
MEINIDESLTTTLERLATGQNTDSVTFATRILNSYLKNQYINQIKEKIDSMEVSKLVEVAAAIDVVKALEKV